MSETKAASQRPAMLATDHETAGDVLSQLKAASQRPARTAPETPARRRQKQPPGYPAWWWH